MLCQLFRLGIQYEKDSGRNPMGNHQDERGLERVSGEENLKEQSLFILQKGRLWGEPSSTWEEVIKEKSQDSLLRSKMGERDSGHKLEQVKFTLNEWIFIFFFCEDN